MGEVFLYLYGFLDERHGKIDVSVLGRGGDGVGDGQIAVRRAERGDVALTLRQLDALLEGRHGFVVVGGPHGAGTLRGEQVEQQRAVVLLAGEGYRLLAGFQPAVETAFVEEVFPNEAMDDGLLLSQRVAWCQVGAVGILLLKQALQQLAGFGRREDVVRHSLLVERVDGSRLYGRDGVDLKGAAYGK